MDLHFHILWLWHEPIMELLILLVVREIPKDQPISNVSLCHIIIKAEKRMENIQFWFWCHIVMSVDVEFKIQHTCLDMILCNLLPKNRPSNVPTWSYFEFSFHVAILQLNALIALLLPMHLMRMLALNFCQILLPTQTNTITNRKYNENW